MAVGKVASREFWQSVRLASRALGDRRLFQPFLLYAAAQLLTLGVLVAFYTPGISLLGEPLVRLLAGEGATHYPQFYIALPFLAERLYVALHVLLGSVLTGTATAMLVAYFAAHPYGLRDALRRARGSYGQLVGVILVTDLVALASSTLSYRVVAGETGPVLAAPFVVRGVALFPALVAQALMAYAVPSLIISQIGFFNALHRSLQIALRNPLVTFLLVVVCFLPHVPLRYLSSKSLFIVENLKPELVAWLLAADIPVGILTGLFLTAGVTRVYLFAAREE